MPRATPPDPPEVVENPQLSDVFEIMTRAVFQAGVSWAQIAKPWDAYRRAFDGFDVNRVAQFGDADVERVLAEPGILRMRRKVAATIKNAAALRDLVKEYGDFHQYVASFSDYNAIVKDVKKRFSFMGDMNVWYLLFRLGERVPRFESWVTTIPGDHPRMREMVDLARATGRSAEATDPDSAGDE
ncbi:MAG: DNA-3-methyladenine glycosylase I [Candidatus Eremiobacteraeota bacterium]|nr:DNA-3-methyladenine glycosylase I [Candidatus Eremiobacteraeota bacterium]